MLPEKGVLQRNIIIFSLRTGSHATHKEKETLDTLTTQGKYALHGRAELTRSNEGHI